MQPAEPTVRIAALDVIRGFALFGVLAVNAAYFAAPLPAVVNPGLPPLAVTEASLWSWYVPFVFFEFKCITLFSMLFGISLFLVGGERTDKQRGTVLRRRLGWMALFGAIHGALIWYGDILAPYAITGFLVLFVRSWSARALLTGGVILFGLSLAMLWLATTMVLSMPSADLAELKRTSWSPPPDAVAAMIAPYHAGLATALAANLGSWIENLAQLMVLLTPRTAGMMMIGLALYKWGFFGSRFSLRVHTGFIVLGAAALTSSAWMAHSAARAGFEFETMQGGLALAAAALSPSVSLGYASILVILVSSGRLTWLTAPFSAVGRMAFSNYLFQSLVMTTLFWGGRGFGLFGEVSRPDLMSIVVVLFAWQMFLSSVWLAHFSTGPLEWVWRRLSYGRPFIMSKDGLSTPKDVGHAPKAHGFDDLAIASEGLGKCFGDQWAVNEVALRVERGAIYGFLGQNGAGKTTTIRMLLGLTRPSVGHIQVFGCDVHRDRINAARQIGALLEARATYDHLTGRENLDATRRMLKLNVGDIERVLDIVDLRAAADRKVGHYSLGMRQRLGLARAMLGRPRLLVLDEPMNGLDPDGMADMRNLIRELPGRSGVTVFLSSHLLVEVQTIATHIGLMQAGRLVLQGATADLLRRAGSELFLRVDAPNRAAAVLEGMGYAPHEQDGGLVVTIDGGDAKTARIAQQIVCAGVDIFELTHRNAGLEALYMMMRTRKIQVM